MEPRILLSAEASLDPLPEDGNSSDPTHAEEIVESLDPTPTASIGFLEDSASAGAALLNEASEQGETLEARPDSGLESGESEADLRIDPANDPRAIDDRREQIRRQDHEAATIEWDGGGDGTSWNDAANWNDTATAADRLPVAADRVLIDLGEGVDPTVNINSAVNIHSLISRENTRLIGGSLTLAHDSEVTDFEWISGLLAAGPRLTNPGNFLISGSANRDLAGVLANAGTMHFTATGQLEFFSSATIENQADGTFIHEGTGLFTNNFNTNNWRVVNSGTWRRIGSGTAQISVPFDIDGGTVEADGATLRLANGGAHVDGTYHVSNGGLIDLTGGTHTFSGIHEGSGDGHVRHVGATATVPSGQTARFQFDPDVYQWGSGTLSLSGILRNELHFQIVGTANRTLGGVFENAATTTYSGTGQLQFSSSARIENLVTGEFHLTQASSFTAFAPRFNTNGWSIQNGGTWSRQGSGTVTTSIAFVNLTDGAVEVETGDLQMNNGSSFADQSVFRTTDNGRVLLVGGTHTFTGVQSGEQTDGTGRVRFLGGTLSVSGTAQFEFPGPMFEWVSGTIAAGASTLEVTGVLNIVGSANRDLSGVIRVAGTAINSATGNIEFFSNARIDVPAGGTMRHLASGGYVSNHAQSGWSINVEGLWRSEGGVATTSIPFNVTGGTVEVDGATFRVNNGGRFANGTYRTANDAVLDLIGGDHVFVELHRGEQSDGTGRVRYRGGLLTAPGGAETGADMDFPGTMLEWSAAQLNAPGGFRILDTWNITGSANRDFSGTIQVMDTGKVIHTATGNIEFFSNARIHVVHMGLYDHRSTGGFVSNHAQSGWSIQVEGIFRHSGPGDAISNIALNNNNGRVEIEESRFSLQGGGANTDGVFEIDSGGLRYNGGTHTFQGAVDFGGLGRVDLNSGTFSVNSESVVTMHMGDRLADPVAGGFHFLGGVTGGSGVLRNAEVAVWTAGRMGNGGGSRFENDGLMRIAGSANRDFQGLLLIRGTVEHTATGNIEFFSNAQIQVSTTGVYEHQSTGNFVSNHAQSGWSIRIDGGTFRHSGPGDAASNITFHNEAGRVEVENSRFSIQGGGTNVAGIYEIGFDGTWRFNGGTHAFDGEPVFQGAGRVEVSGGVFSVNAEGRAIMNLGNAADLQNRGFRLIGGTTGGAGTISNTQEAH